MNSGNNFILLMCIVVRILGWIKHDYTTTNESWKRGVQDKSNIYLRI